LSEKENRKIVHAGPAIARSTAQRKFGRLDVEMIVDALRWHSGDQECIISRL
jgi:hypothetical protein